MTDHLSMLSPEELLLLRLCRLEFNDSQKEEVRSLIEKIIDWERFVTLANEHGIIALCRFNLSKLDYTELVPIDINNLITKSYLASVARNTRIFKLLEEVSQIASEKKIEIVLIKGLALELAEYGNKGLRQMNDLDLLVNRKDAILLRKLLLKEGYISRPMVSGLHEKILPSYGKHLPEMVKDGFSVEIHYKLFEEKGDMSTRNFISNSMSFPHLMKSNLPIRIPSPVEHFIYLVKHLHKHEQGQSSQLRLYADLVILLNKYQNEQFSLRAYELAKQTGLEKNLTDVFFKLNDFFNSEIPINLINVHPHSKGNDINEEFIHFIKNPLINRNSNKKEDFLRPINELQNFKEKVMFIIGYLFPSFSFMKYRYSLRNKAMVILYFPVRWVVFIKQLFLKALNN